MKSDSKKERLLLLAKRVKQLRIEKGLTQEQAYNDTGIHFGRIEQGKRDASFSTLLQICTYFGITPKEFFSEGF